MTAAAHTPATPAFDLAGGRLRATWMPHAGEWVLSSWERTAEGKFRGCRIVGSSPTEAGIRRRAKEVLAA